MSTGKNHWRLISQIEFVKTYGAVKRKWGRGALIRRRHSAAKFNQKILVALLISSQVLIMAKDRVHTHKGLFVLLLNNTDRLHPAQAPRSWLETKLIIEHVLVIIEIDTSMYNILKQSHRTGKLIAPTPSSAYRWEADQDAKLLLPLVMLTGKQSSRGT